MVLPSAPGIILQPLFVSAVPEVEREYLGVQRPALLLESSSKLGRSAANSLSVGPNAALADPAWQPASLAASAKWPAAPLRTTVEPATQPARLKLPAGEIRQASPATSKKKPAAHRGRDGSA